MSDDYGTEHGAVDPLWDDPQLAEQERCWQEFLEARAELAAEDMWEAGYEASDPKHPRFHETRSELWDSREKAA